MTRMLYPLTRHYFQHYTDQACVHPAKGGYAYQASVTETREPMVRYPHMSGALLSIRGRISHDTCRSIRAWDAMLMLISSFHSDEQLQIFLHEIWCLWPALRANIRSMANENGESPRKQVVPRELWKGTWLPSPTRCLTMFTGFVAALSLHDIGLDTIRGRMACKKRGF